MFASSSRESGTLRRSIHHHNMITGCVLRPDHQAHKLRSRSRSRSRRNVRRLVESNADVSLDSGSQVNLGLKVELDTDKESSGLLVAILIGGTLEKLTYELCE